MMNILLAPFESAMGVMSGGLFSCELKRATQPTMQELAAKQIRELADCGESPPHSPCRTEEALKREQEFVVRLGLVITPNILGRTSLEKEVESKRRHFEMFAPVMQPSQVVRRIDPEENDTPHWSPMKSNRWW